MNALLNGFRHYVDFSGREAKGQFWMYILLSQLILVVFAAPVFVTGTLMYRDVLQEEPVREAVTGIVEQLNEGASSDEAVQMVIDEVIPVFLSCFQNRLNQGDATVRIFHVFLALSALWCVFITVPTISATVRRLRDAGQSIWWVLPPVLAFVPCALVSQLAGLLSLVTLVLCCLDSERTEPGQKRA